MTTDGFARDGKFWALAILVGACVLLTFVNLRLGAGVRDMRTNVAERQQFIAESIPLAHVNNQIIQTLANMSARGNDAAIREMLASHGVTFTTSEATSSDPEEAP